MALKNRAEARMHEFEAFKQEFNTALSSVKSGTNRLKSMIKSKARTESNPAGFLSNHDEFESCFSVEEDLLSRLFAGDQAKIEEE
mmetsp:Transcript_15134/g.20532  ORF Transcript_15134/g.20532 Transcript_15134/m.20532 type:complete len:85 (+) Transcript_15134:150-404(+)